MTQTPLDYRGPDPNGPRPNRWWKVALRILTGLTVGVGSCFLGSWFVTLTNIGYLFLLPPLIVLGTAIFIAIKWQHFGYVTGVVLAPFVVAVIGFVMLLIICGSGGFH